MSRALFPVSDHCFQDVPVWAEGTARLPHLDHDRIGHTRWCKCTNCISLPTKEESVCCHELANLTRYITREVKCVTLEETFRDECLDEVLLISHLKYKSKISKNEFLHKRAEFLQRAAYRSFQSWAHGFCGPKRGIPIPACVVSLVRRTFPVPLIPGKPMDYSFSEGPAVDMANTG
ncbi:unnamed protein product [Ranitomeya imitator]|uniref:P2X purinoreceptor 7 intracellular domain-containing protein n=2 Tax=Ranitomeya imitator TaxID=111125 RepID=A0ABN9MB93_9NEOB|nr:unnamed protein product [Ranitomeya imitator]